MKIACNGATGRVGKLLVERHGVLPLSADITKEHDVQAELDAVKPDVILHLAGYSNVEFCEEPENWPQVMKVNFNGALNVIRAANDRKMLVGYISSEHVFSGRKTFLRRGGPYREMDVPDRHVVNSYGLVRLAVEALRHSFPVMKVVRTSYLFDYVRLMTDEFPAPGVYDFPTFIERSYMYLPHFAEALNHYANFFAFMPTILNIAGSKTVSQYKFMSDFVSLFHLDKIQVVKRNKEKEGLAPRPHHSGLNTTLGASLGIPQYSYTDGLGQMYRDSISREDNEPKDNVRNPVL